MLIDSVGKAEKEVFRYGRSSFPPVSSSNYRAIKFYRSLGYGVVGDVR